MSVILKIDPSKKDVIINSNHNGITINNANVMKCKLHAIELKTKFDGNETLKLSLVTMEVERITQFSIQLEKIRIEWCKLL